jgi:hypothetical protein
MIPLISLYATAARPQGWMNLYNILQDNSIPFEIVFVGPNEPDYILPDNFHYIKTDVKPAQCVEIAARSTSGTLIMQIADDIDLVTPKMLDKLYSTYTAHNDKNLIVSCRYMLDGKDLSPTCHYYHSGHTNTPMISVAGLMSNDLYKAVGGIDKNFIAVCSDIDVIMRIHAYGGSVILDDVYVNESSKSHDLYAQYAHIDRQLLDSLWVINRKVQTQRLKSFEPFINECILDESQGPKGRWL